MARLELLTGQRFPFAGVHFAQLRVQLQRDRALAECVAGGCRTRGKGRWRRRRRMAHRRGGVRRQPPGKCLGRERRFRVAAEELVDVAESLAGADQLEVGLGQGGLYAPDRQRVGEAPGSEPVAANPIRASPGYGSRGRRPEFTQVLRLRDRGVAQQWPNAMREARPRWYR